MDHGSVSVGGKGLGEINNEDKKGGLSPAQPLPQGGP